MSKSPETDIQLKLRYEGNWVETDRVLVIPTGKWRFQRPVPKAEKCCQCGRCYLLCPTGSVHEEEDRFVIDLENCKGCGICASVCPNIAIAMVKEDTDEDRTEK